MRPLDAKDREALRLAARKGRVLQLAMLVLMPLLLAGLLLSGFLDRGRAPKPEGNLGLAWALFAVGLCLPAFAWLLRLKLRSAFLAQPLPQAFSGAQVLMAAMAEAMAIFGFAIHMVGGPRTDLLTWSLLALCPLAGWALAPRVEAWIDAAEGR